MIGDVRTIEQLRIAVDEAIYEDEVISMEAIYLALDRIIEGLCEEIEIE